MGWIERDERGSTTPLLALLVVAAGAACLGLGRMGGVANARARAQTAADAAALAGAAEGDDAARELAAANGGAVLSLTTEGDEVQVAVRVSGAEARARATATGRGSRSRGGVAGADTTGLTPAMRAALARAEALLGEPVPITSGWRSYSDQQRLYRHRASNPYPVAPPGTSAHERGTAVDVPLLFVPRLLRIAARAGLCHPWPQVDPVHFELCEERP